MSGPRDREEGVEVHDLVREFGGPRPRIVTLCGSARFREEFEAVAYERTMRGEIVLSVVFPAGATTGEGVRPGSPTKVALDELHKRKIDLCDYVFVLDVGGYLGASTRSEIAYAEALGRPVEYLEGP